MGWDGKQAFASGMDITDTREDMLVIGTTLHSDGRSDRGVYGLSCRMP